MMDDPQSPPKIDVTTWSDVGSRDALDLVAASVAEMVGFEIATISVVRGEQMYSVSVAGSSAAAAALLGLAAPVSVVLRELERADDWGRFRFVPHQRGSTDIDAYSWVPDLTPLDEPDAWHPLDLLIAPLYSDTAALIGLLSIDVPVSGRRPGPSERDLLQRYAVQTERTLRMAVERDELAERIRLADAARRVIRFATSQDDLESVLDDCRHPLLEGFRADFHTIRIYPSPDLPAAGSPPADLPPSSVESIRRVSRLCWTEQRVVVIGPEPRPAPGDTCVDDDAHAVILAATHRVGMSSVLLVPLGSGRLCLGHLILGRRAAGLRWSPDEQAGALDISRDIGQAIAVSRSRTREKRLVDDLRQLTAYKTQVLNTVSHELKNPLAAVTGYLEILKSDVSVAAENHKALDAIDRAATRMSLVVDDLLVLAQVEDPDRAAPMGSVDAAIVLRDVLGDAASHEVTIEVQVPEGEVLVGCTAADLDTVITNLVGNAIKYSTSGGTVSVALARVGGEIEVSVADQGIGISTTDQERLFTEFFRSSNPDALSLPGTGLGLTICARILAQHDGRIEVESVLGVGSTFRAFLPAA